MEHTIVTLLKDGERIAGAFGYDRERGRFHLFRAKAVVLATGGIGRAYAITSNSWEYTGDGHSLAYHAGASLMDMEFVQFHPTGMIWPPSVRGILVTEGVRGEGGVLAQQKRRALHVQRHSAGVRKSNRRLRRGRLALYAGRQERAPSARTFDSRSRRALYSPRSSARAAAARTAASSSTSPGSRKEFPTPPSTSRRSCPACITSSSSWPTSTSRKSPWKWVPRRIT